MRLLDVTYKFIGTWHTDVMLQDELSHGARPEAFQAFVT